jgi:hypothetical protein
MRKSKIKKKTHLEEAVELFKDHGNVKVVAEILCERYGESMEHSNVENHRKKISSWLNSGESPIKKDPNFDNFSETNQYSSSSSSERVNTVPSAIKEDGTYMSITEYCEAYGIPEEHVKTFKLITHSGRGAYYNIASHTLKGKADFENFYDKLIEEISLLPNLPKTISRKLPKVLGSKQNLNKKGDSINSKHLFVVDPADCHIGKLASPTETGDTYNREIAVKRILEGVDGLIQKSRGFDIDKVLFIGGNDILHIDTPAKTTTSGTNQDVDGMWYDNFLVAKDVYIKVIDKLLQIADVHFMFNPSNHDWTHGFFLADVIKTYYKDCENITFDTSIRHRKYFTYYDNLIGTTHGDGAKIADLGSLMAHEASDWSKCKRRYIYTHHVHHKTSKDLIGVTVESVRSPSGTDGWHDRKGYTGVPKAVEGFLHHKTQGQVARLTHIF